MSRPDRFHQVAVDFAPARRGGTPKGRIAGLILLAVLLVGAIGAAVTQLLLR